MHSIQSYYINLIKNKNPQYQETHNLIKMDMRNGGILFQLRYTGENLGPATNDLTDFDYIPRKASPSLGIVWGMIWES